MISTNGEKSAQSEIFSDWHVVADLESLESNVPKKTQLLGTAITIIQLSPSEITVTRDDNGSSIHQAVKYGFLWCCLASPRYEITSIPEAEETDRYLVTGGSIAVKTSGLRLVENFLDMGHFPFVHTDWLGVEPHTEVPPYKVEISDDDEIWATECEFFQPVASPTAQGGFMVDYVYRVFRPYSVALYKSNPVQAERMDSVYLFVQPIDEENCVAHPFLCYLKDEIDEPTIRWFMQLIFAQDKPILENQNPRRLPLDPCAETPIRADASSIVYRRWLRQHNVSYGAIAA